MQITHEEARRLIHFLVDGALKPQEKLVLSTHIEACFECRAYADEIKEVESILLPVMKSQWNLPPPPLSVSTLQAKKETKIPATAILAIRTAALSLAFVAFVFAAWQFTSAGQQVPVPLTVGVPPLPTPLIQTTSTENRFENCKIMIYEVQENDSLTSIADRFFISTEEIMAINNMKAESTHTLMKLRIPICGLTPTVTVDPTSITTTTPVFGLTTSPPDPSG